jgi:hypothetical protein
MKKETRTREDIKADLDWHDRQGIEASAEQDYAAAEYYFQLKEGYEEELEAFDSKYSEVGLEVLSEEQVAATLEERLGYACEWAAQHYPEIEQPVWEEANSYVLDDSRHLFPLFTYQNWSDLIAEQDPPIANIGPKGSMLAVDYKGITWAYAHSTDTLVGFYPEMFTTDWTDEPMAIIVEGEVALHHEIA